MTARVAECAVALEQLGVRREQGLDAARLGFEPLRTTRLIQATEIAALDREPQRVRRFGRQVTEPVIGRDEVTAVLPEVLAARRVEAEQPVAERAGVGIDREGRFP